MVATDFFEFNRNKFLEITVSFFHFSYSNRNINQLLRLNNSFLKSSRKTI